jgi:hypothetical protein
MAIHYAEVGLRPLITGVVPTVIEFPAPRDCRLNRIFARIAAANSAGDVILDVNVNGASIYSSPVDQPRILAGQTRVNAFPVVDLLEGDMVTVDCDAIPLGGVSGLYVIVQLQDAPTEAQYVKDLYQGILLRQPTGPELTSALAVLDASTSDTILDQTLTLQNTVIAGLGSITDDQFVERLYNGILGRLSDPGGFAFWHTQMVGGMTRTSVHGFFNGSIEHQNLRVQPWYPQLAVVANAYKIRGKDVSNTAPTLNQVLVWNGTNWAPTTLDVLSSSFDHKDSARAATTGALPSYTAAAGVLTATANAALPAQDGITIALNESLLVKDETGGNQKYNGIYTLTQVGDGTHPWKLTRRADANTSARVTANILAGIEEGTTLADTQWWLTTNNPITLDTTALVFQQFGKQINPNITYFWQSETPPQNGTHKRFYTERAGTISGVRPTATLGDGTVTAQLDVLKNGVSIYPSATKPNVPAGSFVNGSFTPDTTSFVDGDYFQVNVVNNGNCIGPLRLAIIFKEP